MLHDRAEEAAINSLESSPLNSLIQTEPGLFIRQVKEWAEIFTNFETKNKYEILTTSGNQVGAIIEGGEGIWSVIKRIFLRSHRPLKVEVYDKNNQALINFSREFFFFFSDLYIRDGRGSPIGSVHRRWGILYKKYDLRDQRGQRVFATIKSPLWRLWTFPIFDQTGDKKGEITKKWQGLLKEAFTDADQFYVDFGGGHWSPEQRLVIFAAAISIDFDFFEDNSKQNRD